MVIAVRELNQFRPTDTEQDRAPVAAGTQARA
jgi:hypothetical protein